MKDNKMIIEDEDSKNIAVLTPVYNRAYILGQLYQSLLDQKNKNFDWYIVNDGSTDYIEDLVNTWIHSDNGFQIYYFKKENGGKHRAINFVIPHIKNEFTIIVDSDDYLLDDATDYIEKWIISIQGNERFAGIAGLRGYPSGEMIGEYPPKYREFIDAKNTDRIKKHLTGDKAEAYRTSVLKKYPFPEFEGEKYIAESVVWNQIALDGYKIRWYPQIIYITEYLEDGLTKNLENNRLKNWKGYTLDTFIIMQTKGFSKYRYLGRYINLSRKKNKTSMNKICCKLEINYLQFLLGTITGTLQHFYDCSKRI